jgi:SulP family sulfate permease
MMDQREAVVGGPASGLAKTERVLRGNAIDVARDLTAGFVASVLLIANIVSFGALMFPGDLGAGAPIAVWAMLIGSCIGGVWIARATSLPPLATGIDSPSGAVLALLSSATASRVLKAGGSPEAAVQCVMLIFTVTTLMSGALLHGLGRGRWASHFRFVPYFVVGGFLSATGWLLIVGGIRMTVGGSPSLERLATQWTAIEVAKVASAVATLAVLLALRRWNRSAFAMPAALVLMWLFGAWGLHTLGLSGPEHRWYFPSLGTLGTWSPLSAAGTAQVHWPILAGLFPEMLAVTVVALISLVTKVASLEVARQASGDLDHEFRAHGMASLLAAPFGGLIASLQVGTSRLLEQAGGVTRMSGVMCALVMGVVGLASVDLPGLIPIPIVAGLVFYLGYTFIMDAFRRPLAQRAWPDLCLAIGIMIVCVRYGYLAGVLVGVVCACLLFATSYARIGVVRRAVTRAQFASYVERSTHESEQLRERGEAIRVYWLSGYMFFGSSESVFERVRRDIEALPPRTVDYVIVDFGLVSGADSSAVMSLTKVRNYCDQQGATLVCCSLSSTMRDAIERGGVLRGTSGHRAFGDLNLALAWCEDQLLARAGAQNEAGMAGFESWLQRQLGAGVRVVDLLAYFERKDLDGSHVLYHRGEAADTVDFVASGSLVVDIPGGEEESLRVRRIMTHTVVGEMGFFRRSVRSATVCADGPAIVFTITRASFGRMRSERPDLATAFYEFIIGVLAERLEFSDRMVTALRR